MISILRSQNNRGYRLKYLRGMWVITFAVVMTIGTTLTAPAAWAADAEADEGDKVVFTFNKPSGFVGSVNAVRYSYKTEDITAKAGDDYEARSRNLTFPSGTGNIYKQLKVDTISDNIDEGNGETFRLKLTDPKWYNKSCSCWQNMAAGPSQIVQTGKIREP